MILGVLDGVVGRWQAGNTTRVRWGAIGEEGSVSEKEHKSEAAAAKFVETKIKEKEKGGYVEKTLAAGGGGGKRKAAADTPVGTPAKKKAAPAAAAAAVPPAAAAASPGGGGSEVVHSWCARSSNSQPACQLLYGSSCKVLGEAALIDRLVLGNTGQPSTRSLAVPSAKSPTT